MENHTFPANIRDLIAQDELAEALQQLHTILDNSPLLDEAILQAARFADIRKQIRLGLVDQAEANLTQNQIRAGMYILATRAAQFKTRRRFTIDLLRWERPAKFS